MVIARPKATVSITLVRILLKYIARAHADFVEICHTVGLDLSLVENSEARISAKQFQAIWEEAVKRINNRNFGLHFGVEIAKNYPGGHVLFNAMMNSPTVGEAMDRFIRYNNLMADAVQPKMEVENNLVHLSLDTVNKDVKIPRHISEALLSSYIHIFRHLTENKLKLIRVRFSHSQPEDIREHKRIFEAPILFGQADNELVIERNFLDLPIFLADPEFLETLDRFAQRLLDRLYLSSTWSDRVIRLLGNLLVRNKKTDIETIAESLGMSVRNLQLKLKEEGTTYQKLFSTVRKEIALNYLKEKEATICDIAFLLGFSEQSAFNHAFKRWTGFTPREYLRRVEESKSLKVEE